jgi:hypothetical protein
VRAEQQLHEVPAVAKVAKPQDLTAGADERPAPALSERMTMRLVCHALALALAVGSASMVGCGSNGSNGGEPDGALHDAFADDAPEDAASEDGASDGPSDAAVSDGPDAESVTPGESGPGAATGTLTVAVDASLRTTLAGGPCAAVSSFVAAPNRASIGHAINLVASGVDPNYQSSDVTLTWAASGGFGSLTATTGTSNTFTCASAGSETVTVTAAISGGGASCPGTGGLVAALTCVAP